MSNISIIAYLVLTLSIGYAFIYSPFGELTALSDQKQSYLDSLEMVNNIETKKGELLTKFNAIPEADKKSIETILPSSLNFVRLISQIDSVAAGYGISINNISSKEMGSSVGNSVGTAGPQRPYQSSIIGFSFTSSYVNFNAFLDDLEKSMRILDIKTAKIQPQENGLYLFSVEFETYWLQ